MGKKKTIYVIIMLFLGAGILFCGGAIKMGQMMDEENEQLYSGYAEPTTESNAEDDAETEYVPVHVDWSALRKKNNEVVGWIWVDADNEADVVSYPVMCRAGDRDYYLRHNIGKQYSKYGTPYIPGDYDLDGKVVSIHGHNFGSDTETMFSPLVKYQEKDYAARHSVIWYAKVGENVQPYKIFSVIEYDCTALDAGQGCWNYLQTDFGSDEEYAEWLAEAKARSLFEIGEMPSSEAQVVILSTCETAKTTSIRCVVFAYREVIDDGS